MSYSSSRIYEFKALEWLDEDAYNINDHDTSFLKLIVLQELYDDLKEEFEAYKANIDDMPVEQTRAYEQNAKFVKWAEKLSGLQEGGDTGSYESYRG